jgi:hypothetical protein
MDPIANLEAQRASVAEINAITDRQASRDPRDTDLAQIQGLASQLAEQVEALDAWRTHGGFDPYASPVALGREQISWHLMGQLLDALMYRIPMEVRRQVMHEVPAAYNAWCGRRIVVTHVTPPSDGDQSDSGGEAAPQAPA